MVEVEPVLERFAELNGIEKINSRIDVSTVGGPYELMIWINSGDAVLANDERILKAAETDEELKRLIVMWELSDG